MLRRVGEAFAGIEGRAAPFYGLAAALAIAVPLLAGTLTGYAEQGARAALGAFLVAVTAPAGPYGARAKSLAITVTVVAAGATVGGLLNGHRWAPIVVIPLVVVLGAAIPRIGPTAALAVLLSSLHPAGQDLFYGGLYELVGGVLVSLLFLAPWPVFRLRPLRTVLAEAAEAVAGALEAVTGEAGGWTERRMAALRALAGARGTYELYRVDRRESNRPERVINTLGQIMRETVTLRTLVEAARSDPDRETRAAVAELVTRLRLLATAIAPPVGMTAGMTADQVPTGRLRRLREENHEEKADDLVAAALADQTWWSLDRIAGDVDHVSRLVRDGLRLGLATPRLPRFPAPWTYWTRFRKAVANRSPRLRQLIRVGLVVTIAAALVSAVQLPNGHWLTLTVVLNLRNTYGETATRAMQMVIGTAIGAVFATAVLVLAPDRMLLALVLFVFTLAGFTLRSVNYTLWALFGATPTALILLDFASPSGWTAAAERISWIVVGCGLALLGSRTLWPTAYATRLPAQLARLLDTHAQLARVTADVTSGSAAEVPRALILEAEQAAGALREARNRLSEEPLPDAERISMLRAALAAANRTRDQLVAIAGLTHDEAAGASSPLPGILRRLADRLEEAAAEVGTRSPPPSPEGWLDEDLAELDEYLVTLTRRRRAEVTGSEPATSFTPLHQTLLQAAGARHALRSLRSDTDELCCSALAAQARD